MKISHPRACYNASDDGDRHRVKLQCTIIIDSPSVSAKAKEKSIERRLRGFVRHEKINTEVVDLPLARQILEFLSLSLILLASAALFGIVLDYYTGHCDAGIKEVLLD